MTFKVKTVRDVPKLIHGMVGKYEIMTNVFSLTLIVKQKLYNVIH